MRDPVWSLYVARWALSVNDAGKAREDADAGLLHAQVPDGLATDSKVVTITIVGGNDAPTAGGQVTDRDYGTDRHE